MTMSFVVKDKALLDKLAVNKKAEIARSGELADWNLAAVGALTTAIGLGYTVVSEHVNVALGHRAYAASMPVVPVLDVGLSPFAQWIVVPLAAFWLLSRVRRGSRRSELDWSAE